jgi:hypothetical protein
MVIRPSEVNGNYLIGGPNYIFYTVATFKPSPITKNNVAIAKSRIPTALWFRLIRTVGHIFQVVDDRTFARIGRALKPNRIAVSQPDAPHRTPYR